MALEPLNGLPPNYYGYSIEISFKNVMALVPLNGFPPNFHGYNIGKSFRSTGKQVLVTLNAFSNSKVKFSNEIYVWNQWLDFC